MNRRNLNIFTVREKGNVCVSHIFRARAMSFVSQTVAGICRTRPDSFYCESAQHCSHKHCQRRQERDELIAERTELRELQQQQHRKQVQQQHQREMAWRRQHQHEHGGQQWVIALSPCLSRCFWIVCQPSTTLVNDWYMSTIGKYDWENMYFFVSLFTLNTTFNKLATHCRF